ncbi:MAG TPA: YhjD/YihY/BrkB family envelope integrity protein, partial [Vicinamibacterales bacterium]|nr:YhjD/YihY/BrkB family envelope integrity protein [Vicinamibacterales bacterium]
MLAHLRVPLGWKDLLKRSAKEALADDVFDLAAQQAYYFFFALFPALLFVMAVASFFPVQDLIDTIVAKIAQIAPGDAVTLLRETLKSIAEQNSGGILTFAFLVTIWSSSGAMVS